MDITTSFRDPDQARRLRHSILLFIILATLPCYCIGAVLLGVAPQNEESETRNEPTRPAPDIESVFTETPTATLTPTLFSLGTTDPNATATEGDPLRATPRQFIPPTRTPLVLPSATPSPTASATTQQSNRPPRFNTAPGDVTVEAGKSVTVTLDVSDPDGDVVLFNAVAANTGVATASQTGATTFSVTGVAAGSTTIDITLSDNKGGLATRTITVTVTAAPNTPPRFTADPANVTVKVGETASVNLQFTDDDGDTVTFSATAGNGNITVTPDSASSFTVLGVTEGDSTVTITLSDGKGGSDNRTINVTIEAAAPTNTPPTFTLNPPAILSVSVGDSTIVIFEATDGDGDTVTFTTTSLPLGIVTITPTVPSSTYQFTIFGATEGTTIVTVLLNDGNGGTAQRTIEVTVTAAINQAPQFDSPPGNVSVNVGGTTTVTLFYSDPDGDPVTFTDTSDNAGIATVGPPAGNTFTVTGVAPGTTSVNIVLSDGQGGTTPGALSVTVNP